jgi:hypothetical protein
MKTLVALVGTKHRGPEMVALLASLPQGEPLALVRDRQNPFDPNAIKVIARDQHIGFIKASQAAKIAAKMDYDPLYANRLMGGAGGPVARLAIDGGKQPMVEIDE